MAWARAWPCERMRWGTRGIWMLRENKASLVLFDGDRTPGMSNLKVGKTYFNPRVQRFPSLVGWSHCSVALW